MIPARDLERELSWLDAVPLYREALAQSAQLDRADRITLDKGITALVLTRLVVFNLVEAELDARGLALTEQDFSAAVTSTVGQITLLVGDQGRAVQLFNKLPPDFRIELVARQAETDLLRRALPIGDPTDAQLLAFYDANRELFEEVCARYILSRTRDQSLDALARLQRGEEFGAVARSASADPATAGNGGDVGCFLRRGQVEAVFAQAAFETSAGSVAGPIEAAVGWYIVNVYDRRGDAFEEVRDQVATRFAESGPAIAFQSLMQRLVATARVEVNPRYGKWDDGSSRVVPFP